MNKQLKKQNREFINQSKPISPEGLKHFGVLTQMQLSANNFTMQPLDDNKEITQTYLSQNFKSYFSPVYKHHINFAIEDKEEHFINHLDFGETGQLKINSDFDYLNKMILCFQLPKLEIRDEYLIELLNSMFQELDIDISLNKITRENLNILFPQIVRKIKYKNIELLNVQKIIDVLLSDYQKFIVNKELSNTENLIFQLLVFISANISIFNTDKKDKIMRIIDYILKCITNINVNDYIIQAIFKFKTVRIEKLIYSLDDEEFKNHIDLNNIKKDKQLLLSLLNKNYSSDITIEKLYLLKINETDYKLIRTLKDGDYLVETLDECKIIINGEEYIYFDNILFKNQEFKKFLFVSQAKTTSFLRFYNSYIKNVLSDDYNSNISDYFIYSTYLNLKNKFKSNIEVLKNIDELFKPFILSSEFLNQFLNNDTETTENNYSEIINDYKKNEIIDEYYLSIDFVYCALNFLSSCLLNNTVDLIFISYLETLKTETNIFISKSVFNVFDFLEFYKFLDNSITEIKKDLNNQNIRDIVENIQKNLINLLSVHFSNYFFYDVLKVLILNNKEITISDIDYVLSVLSKYKINKSEINNLLNNLDNFNSFLFSNKKISELTIDYNEYFFKSYDDLNNIIRENIENLNNLGNSNIIQNYILKHKKSIFEELRWILSEFELINRYNIEIDFSNNETIRKGIFDIGINIIVYLIPFLKKYLFSDDESQNNITNIKVYIKQILTKEKKIISNTLDKYQSLFDDLNNNQISGFEYFTDLKYIEDIGYNIFDYVEISCNNQTIEKMGNEYIKIYDSLHLTAEHEKGINKMINGINGIIYIPLHFFFCDYYKLSLPLLCLKNSEIIFKIKLKKLNEVIKTNILNTDLITDKMIKKYKFKSWVLNKYIIIDESVRTQILKYPQEFLINQVQYSSYYNLNKSNDIIVLNLKNCIKYLVFYISNVKPEEKPIKTFQLYYNGIQRSVKTNYIYNNLALKYNNFSRCEDDNIYIVNFSLYPEELQPSGSCDFSYLDKIEIKFEFNQDVLEKYKNIKLQIYGLSYNILKTSEGIGIIKFES